MSKLAHSHQPTMDEIERRRLKAEGFPECETCNGTGAINAPFSGSDPCCPDCDGIGYIVE
tara:strand:- start:463 stop:642 length:180 start_codon:yes stop_codon:yes gene_type:complete